MDGREREERRGERGTEKEEKIVRMTDPFYGSGLVGAVRLRANI